MTTWELRALTRRDLDEAVAASRRLRVDHGTLLLELFVWASALARVMVGGSRDDVHRAAVQVAAIACRFAEEPVSRVQPFAYPVIRIAGEVGAAARAVRDRDAVGLGGALAEIAAAAERAVREAV